MYNADGSNNDSNNGEALLLSMSGLVTTDRKRQFARAVHSGNVSFVEAIIKRGGIDIDAPLELRDEEGNVIYISPMNYAIRKGDVKLAQFLFDANNARQTSVEKKRALPEDCIAESPSGADSARKRRQLS